jgi:hypothetical protein
VGGQVSKRVKLARSKSLSAIGHVVGIAFHWGLFIIYYYSYVAEPICQFVLFFAKGIIFWILLPIVYFK